MRQASLAGPHTLCRYAHQRGSPAMALRRPAQMPLAREARNNFHPSRVASHLSRLENGDDLRLEWLAKNDGFAVGQIDIQFAPDAELANQVDAWFDGKTCSRHEAAPISALQVVDIGTIAVHFLPNGVPGAVQEPVFIAGIPDDLPAHLIHFPATGKVLGRDTSPDECQRSIARLPHDREDLTLASRNRGAHVASPGNVRVDAAGLRSLGPEINQDQGARADPG